MAELELGGQEAADLRWVLDVREGPSFTLWDKIKLSKVEVETIGEVLTLLEEKGADKDSPA